MAFPCHQAVPPSSHPPWDVLTHFYGGCSGKGVNGSIPETRPKVSLFCSKRSRWHPIAGAGKQALEPGSMDPSLITSKGITRVTKCKHCTKWNFGLTHHVLIHTQSMAEPWVFPWLPVKYHSNSALQQEAHTFPKPAGTKLSIFYLSSTSPLLCPSWALYSNKFCTTGQHLTPLT